MYQLNPQAARQADERAGRITDIGDYVGKFTRAENVASARTGSRGIEFAFETEDKQSATFALWTLDKSSKELFGFRMLAAIMTVLKVRSLEPTRAMVRKYDRHSNGVVDIEAEVFKDLMAKPIGVLFETEEYEKTNGGVGSKVVFAGCFDPVTKLTASEILDKKVQPLKLAANIKTLKHRELKRASGGNGGGGYGGNAGHPNAPGNDGGGFDDPDIPF